MHHYLFSGRFLSEHANDSHGQKLHRALCGILISGRQRHNGNMKIIFWKTEVNFNLSPSDSG